MDHPDLLRKSPLNRGRSISTIALLSSALFLFAACGGGGGGGGGSDFVGAASVAISDQPSSIDTGSRTKVTTEVMDIHPQGILLKFRFPTGLSYVRNSAEITVDEISSDTAPGNIGESGAYKYIVFFLKKSNLGNNNYGSISFELRGDAPVRNGKVEVDADVNDPQVSDDTEFNIEEPEFSEADSCSIEVTG